MSKKKSEHYVNNKELLEALIVYRTKVEASYLKKYDKDLTKQPKEERAKTWEGKPPISNYLGECFLKIATHLSYKPNFVNYMFRDDMISDGIENCVQYIHNFDPAKSNNPLHTLLKSFTMLSFVAFRRRRSNWKLRPRLSKELVLMKWWWLTIACFLVAVQTIIRSRITLFTRLTDESCHHKWSALRRP